MRKETNSYLFPLVSNDATNATKLEMRKTENFSEENKIVKISRHFTAGQSTASNIKV